MNRIHAFSLSLCLLAATAATTFAQAPGFGPGGEMPGRDRRGPGGPSMGIVPPGKFWTNPETVKLLNLTPDQQKQMDSIFRESRAQLIQLHAALEEEQLNLDPILNANPFDQAKAFAEISKLADLRANLEKADIKMLLGLRAVLTPDQWTKVQTEMHSRPHESRRPGQGGWQQRPNQRPEQRPDQRGPNGPGAQNNPPPPPPPSGDDATGFEQ